MTTAPPTAPPAPPPAQPAPIVADFAARAQSLEALRAAVVEAAGVGAGLWFSYVFALLYLLIAAGSVTHRDLLLQTPIKLPFLGVDLPLVGFFALDPLLFLIAHAYVLLHFVLLAGKVGIFHAELQAQIADEEVRARLRRQLPSNIFVQLLAGPREVRSGVIGFMLRLIAYVSLVVGPLALLVFFQLQFLPYHHEWVTWWHRFAVLADLVLLWMLWPSVAHGKTTRVVWRDFQTRKVAATALASLILLFFVFTIATFPHEWLDARLPSVRFIPTKWPLAKDEAPPLTARVQSVKWASLHELLIVGDIDYVARKPTSLWSNRLVLPDIDVDRAKFDTEGKIKTGSETLSLRGRRLEKAVLIGARLRNVDLTGAQLQGAFLREADLREAKFCERRPHEENCANLQDANLYSADLRRTDLRGADLHGAGLYDARLQGADLRLADLHDANLDLAYLQGANLSGAKLQGARLVGARMRGADFGLAQLQGATFSNASTAVPYIVDVDWGLHGADLGGAGLEFADLTGTPLQGADLGGAKLQGAKLDGAQLQGVNLAGASLQGASLDQAFVWRADPRKMSAQSARIVNPNKEPPPSGWFSYLKRQIEEQVSKGEPTGEALKRIAILDGTNLDEQTDAAILDEWDKLAKDPPSVSEHETVLVEILQQIGCKGQWAPVVIESSLAAFRRFSPHSPHLPQIAGVFLDETQCPGARGLSERVKEYLRRIPDRASSTPPGPPAVLPNQ